MIFGTGVCDIKGVSATNAYSVWHSLMRRSYSSVYKESKPAYWDVTANKDWHLFSNFLDWYDSNYVEGWVLDKDILVKGNREYGPNTCCFVPAEINCLLINNKPKEGLPLGVYYKIKNSCYIAQFSVSAGKRKTLHLGCFNNPKEAHKAYVTGKSNYIKMKAEEYKHMLRPDVYYALIHFKV